MKHPEGLRISLVEEGMLDGSGVLRSSESCPVDYGLPESSVLLFSLVAAAGDDGLAQSKLPRELLDNLKEAMLPLEMQNLVSWERDNRGRLAYLVLTWKGKEALEAARTQKTDHGTWATRRRASVSPGEAAKAQPSATRPPREPSAPRPPAAPAANMPSPTSEADALTSPDIEAVFAPSVSVAMRRRAAVSAPGSDFLGIALDTPETTADAAHELTSGSVDDLFA